MELDKVSTSESAQLLQRGVLSPIQLRLLSLLPELEAALEQFLQKKIKASSPESISAFGRLPEAHQMGAVKALEGQLVFLQEIIRSEMAPYNEKSLVRLAMGKLSLFGDDNSLDQILSTDIVEIFDPEHIQVYRSFSCFGLCNYSIAELITYPWYELYDRPRWVTGKLLELGESVFSGKHVSLNLEELVPAYTLRETLTDEKAAFQVQEKFCLRMISALTREPYLLSVKRITPVDSDENANIAFL